MAPAWAFARVNGSAVAAPEFKSRVCGVAAHVVSNTAICRDHVAIELVVAEFPSSQPGQFLQLQCTPAGEPVPRVVEWPAGGLPSLGDRRDWGDRQPFLRRPFSIADQWCDPVGQTHLMVISRTVGPGTAWMERLAPGETLNITGPLGHGFEIPADDVPMVLVGGGVGIPPLLYLARRLNEYGRRHVTVMLGATTRDRLPVRLIVKPAADGTPLMCAELAGKPRFPTVITTDDGTCGMPGVVTDALRRWRSRRPGGADNGALAFACGPQAMLRAVAEATRALGLSCQLCIERHMGCGLGTCLSCVVRVRDESKPEGWRWALACQDGPVFDREQLVE
jgi:dihydroorotate dehydrogenase electron transfer subunit